MEQNPYQSPEHAGPQPKPNPLIVAGLSILALIVATDLIIGGVVKTFIWGQVLFGVVSLAAGGFLLERVARHLRVLYYPKQKSGSSKKAIVVGIWAAILVGVLIDLMSVIQAFR